MANHRKNKSTYRSNYSGYRPSNSNYSSPYRNRKQQDETSAIVHRFIIQAGLCLCILMGVLIIQKLPTKEMYSNIKSGLLSEFPFARLSSQYNAWLNSMFPFENNLPVNKTDTTTVSGGVSGDVVTEDGAPGINNSSESLNVLDYLTKIQENLVLKDFNNGVIIQVEMGENIPSIVPGMVLNIGIDEQISNYVKIQLDNDMILTYGFLENLTVSKYEHIKEGEILGIGSVIEEPGTEFGDHSYYYLSLQKDEEYLDINAFLEQMMQ